MALACVTCVYDHLCHANKGPNALLGRARWDQHIDCTRAITTTQLRLLHTASPTCRAMSSLEFAHGANPLRASTHACTSACTHACTHARNHTRMHASARVQSRTQPRTHSRRQRQRKNTHPVRKPNTPLCTINVVTTCENYMCCHCLSYHANQHNHFNPPRRTPMIHGNDTRQHYTPLFKGLSIFTVVRVCFRNNEFANASYFVSDASFASQCAMLILINRA